jgi:pyridoxamine 5'-phosphate oxidase
VHARPLRKADVHADPLAQFQAWFREASDAGLRLPEAVVLATATEDGVPSARMVLLKGADERGFSFFTNTESRKADELEANDRAALLFYWDPLGRQVRIEGRAAPVRRDESAEYFDTRPRGSQIAAWASRQSTVLEGRDELEAEVQRRAAEFEGDDVPLPPWWGGYRLVPERYEFWQHRDDRLHDRLAYEPDGAGGWRIVRLSP